MGYWRVNGCLVPDRSLAALCALFKYMDFVKVPLPGRGNIVLCQKTYGLSIIIIIQGCSLYKLFGCVHNTTRYVLIIMYHVP